MGAYYNVMESSPRKLLPDQVKSLQDHTTRFLSFWKAAGGHMVFKHHCFWHMSERCGELGNPRTYWTYADENENRFVKILAQTIHGGTRFYDSFFDKFLLLDVRPVPK